MTATARTRTGRRAALLASSAVLAAAALALTGCDPAQSGSAAVVGDVRITETEVNTAVYDAVAAQRAAGGQPEVRELMRRQVDIQVASVLLDEMAEQNDITVTEGEIDAFIRQQGGDEAWQAAMVQRGLAPDQARDFARLQVQIAELSDALGPDANLGEEAAKVGEELGVEVSPRYGVWDPEQVTVVAAPDDLSQPAAAPVL